MITKEISIKWTIEDVDEVIRARRLIFNPKLTEMEKGRVLDNVLSHHDANEGVTWDTLAVWAEKLYGDRYQGKNKI